MRVILGIGNPGPSYASTRHNVGWLVLDELAEVHQGRWEKGFGPYREQRVAGGEALFLLVKPLTYVNRTGEAALAICERYGISPSEFLVIVDDVHLPIGDLRLRQGGSSGGHNGLRSLDEMLGTNNVPRLRIGIGAPPQFGALVEYVLSPFAPEEESTIRGVVRAGAAIAQAFGRGGYAEAAAAYSQSKQTTVPDDPGAEPLRSQS